MPHICPACLYAQHTGSSCKKITQAVTLNSHYEVGKGSTQAPSSSTDYHYKQHFRPFSSWRRRSLAYDAPAAAAPVYKEGTVFVQAGTCIKLPQNGPSNTAMRLEVEQRAELPAMMDSGTYAITDGV
jgi:hypothetical protein